MKLPPSLLKQIALVGTTGLLLTTSCHFQTPSTTPPEKKLPVINKTHSTTAQNPEEKNTPKPTELKTLFIE